MLHGLVFALVFFSPPAFSADCLDLPKVIADMALTLKNKGKYVQSVTDLKILKGKESIDDEFLRTFGANIVAGNSSISEKIAARQDDCKRLTFQDIKDVNKYELIISDKSTEKELVLSLDWDVVLDKFVNEHVKGLEAEAKQKYLDKIDTIRAEWIKSRKSSVIWTIRKSGESELTHVLYRKFTDQIGTPETETTIVVRWGFTVEAAAESEKAADFRKSVAEAVAASKKPKKE